MSSATIDSARAARRRRVSRPAGLLQSVPYVTLLALVVGVPVLLLVTYSFRPSTFGGVGSGFTLENYRSVFESSAYLRVVWHSVAVGLIVAMLVTALSFVLAYAIGFRFRGRFAVAALAIVVVASVASLLVRIYAWGTILGTQGLINRALSGLGLIDEPLGFLFFGYFAIVVTMTYVYLPLGVLIVHSAMQEVDPRSLEASRDLGAGRWRTAFSVVGPQARTGLLGAFALTLILSSADYITPTLVGGVRGTMVGVLVRSLALEQGNAPGAAALAFVFIALLLAAGIALYLLLRICATVGARLAPYVNRSWSPLGRHVPERVSKASFSRLAGVLLVAYLVIPTLVVLVFSFNSGQSLGLPWRGFTLDWYGQAVHKAGFTESLNTSIELAVVSVLAATLIGVVGGFALRNAAGRLRRAIWVATFLPYAVPGVLLGAAILTIAIDHELQLGLGATILAHTILSAPLTILVVATRLESMDPRIVEAARDLGSGPLRALRTVRLPLLFPAILGSALFNVAYSLDELTVTSFTIGTANTLPVWLFGQARNGFTPAVNALGVMLLIGTLMAFVLAALVLRRGVLRTDSEI